MRGVRSKRVFKNIKDVNITLRGNEDIHNILAARKIVILSGSKTKVSKEKAGK